MAEVLIYVTDEVRPDDQFQDGDVVCAFNHRRIRTCHAQMLCKATRGEFTNGIYPSNTPHEQLAALTHEFKFEHVGNEIKRTVISTGDFEMFQSNQPNASGEYINVDEFVSEIRKRNLSVFGSVGNERWYGGNTSDAQVTLDAVWAMIEAETPYREVNYSRWPLSPEEKAQFLAVPTTVIEDEIAATMENLERSTSPEQPGYDPENYYTNWKRRVGITNWRDLPGVVVEDVFNRNKEIDYRESLAEYDVTTMDVKPRKTVFQDRTEYTTRKSVLEL
jgi:hypothetical protein